MKLKLNKFNELCEEFEVNKLDNISYISYKDTNKKGSNFMILDVKTRDLINVTDIPKLDNITLQIINSLLLSRYNYIALCEVNNHRGTYELYNLTYGVYEWDFINTME